MSGPSRQAVDCGRVGNITVIESHTYSIVDGREELMHTLPVFDIGMHHRV